MLIAKTFSKGLVRNFSSGSLATPCLILDVTPKFWSCGMPRFSTMASTSGVAKTMHMHSLLASAVPSMDEAESSSSSGGNGPFGLQSPTTLSSALLKPTPIAIYLDIPLKPLSTFDESFPSPLLWPGLILSLFLLHLVPPLSSQFHLSS
ncbi:hypothetical protein P8452_75041 [Trifolium repens]|nr:hypothetical protein QL285_092223 [Trifolium repens]WJX93529.1 hypothetical protein P8452_75041 [Trifolium repens]